MIDKKNSVCFSGYRSHKFSSSDDLPAIRANLSKHILHYVQEGYHTFLSGMADGFDMMAAEEVVKVKSNFPSIRFIAVIPCHHWRELSAYEQEIFNQADDLIAISEHAGTKAYHARNRYLVDNSSVLICYYSAETTAQKGGGTKYTINYATQKKLKIINIFDVIQSSYT